MNSTSLIVNDDTKYLNYEFNSTIIKDIFPEDLQFEFYFTSINGLLLYSIDWKLNQLIIYLDSILVPQLIVELRNVKSVKNMKDLCNCTNASCLYQSFSFKFQIKNSIIIIQCNNGIIDYPMNSNTELNDKYPIPQFINNEIAAYLWFINIPIYKNKNSIVYSNNDFPTGCISNITYKSIPIPFKPMDNFNECTNQCIPGICNGGKCIELVHSKPICDCFDTYLNGNYCNSSRSSNGFVYENIQWKSLKLSWNCDLKNLFSLISNKKNISIYVNDNKILEFFYSNSAIQYTNEIMTNYSKNKYYIFIITFENRNINIKFKSEFEEWKHFYVYINEHFTYQYFNNFSLEQLCNNGDLVYKLEDEITWKYFDTKNISLKTVINNTISHVYEESIYNDIWKGVIIVILFIFNIIVVILIIWIRKTIKLIDSQKSISKVYQQEIQHTIERPEYLLMETKNPKQ